MRLGACLSDIHNANAYVLFIQLFLPFVVLGDFVNG